MSSTPSIQASSVLRQNTTAIIGILAIAIIVTSIVTNTSLTSIPKEVNYCLYGAGTLILGIFLYRCCKHQSAPISTTNTIIAPNSVTIPALSVSATIPITVSPLPISTSTTNLSSPTTVTWTPKIYEIPKSIEAPVFTPLTSTEVTALLEQEPRLKSHRVARNSMIAFNSIISIHTRGIPARITNPTSNLELRDQMRFILFHISKILEPKKRSEELMDLARDLEDCVAVTQGNISKRFLKYFGKYRNAFILQLIHLLMNYKDKLVDECIYELLPAMRDPNYANIYDGTKQFPHVKSGFIKLCGPQIGLKDKGADEDPEANMQLATKHRESFLSAFRSKCSFSEILKLFIMDINNNTALYITNEDFLKWFGDQNLGDSWMYDETRAYPSYCNQPTSAQENYTQAYIDEAVAIQVFKHLGFIADVNNS